MQRRPADRAATESRYDYPHTIDNGAGETLVFERRIPTPDGDRLEGGNIVEPGAGAPMHVHFLQSETFTVLEGRLAYHTPGEPERFAGPGETAIFPAGMPHGFRNPGTTVLRCSATLDPAHNVEYLLTELFASAKRQGTGRPSLFDAAYLMRRYRSEYAFLGVPRLVQRLLFPPVVLLGTMMGRYRRYADAPEAVRASSR